MTYFEMEQQVLETKIAGEAELLKKAAEAEKTLEQGVKACLNQENRAAQAQLAADKALTETAAGLGLASAKGAVKGYHAIENGTVNGYRAIEKGVVEGFAAIEKTVVGTYKKVEDRFVETFLAQEGETVGQAKQRIRQARRP